MPVTLRVALLLFTAGCQSAGGELSLLPQQPPLDYAVMVTGGALLGAQPGVGQVNTFQVVTPTSAAEATEPLALDMLQQTLRENRVFQRTELEPDRSWRHDMLARLRGGNVDPQVQAYLESLRDRGFDLLLVVEQLQDGPVESLGVNGRWPITLATWFLLGVGVLIPDHTFESRATLRITLRDLQTGRVLHDPLLGGGPIDLSMIERSDFVGLLMSILVPPFWVGDDQEGVRTAIRDVTAQRLLQRLARELKSDLVRQRLRERAVAAIDLGVADGSLRLRIDATADLVSVRVRIDGEPLAAGPTAELQRSLLASRRRDGDRFHYEASMAAPSAAAVQVLVATIGGDIASATFVPEVRR